MFTFSATLLQSTFTPSSASLSTSHRHRHRHRHPNLLHNALLAVFLLLPSLLFHRLFTHACASRLEADLSAPSVNARPFTPVLAAHNQNVTTLHSAFALAVPPACGCWMPCPDGSLELSLFSRSSPSQPSSHDLWFRTTQALLGSLNVLCQPPVTLPEHHLRLARAPRDLGLLSWPAMTRRLLRGPRDRKK